MDLVFLLGQNKDESGEGAVSNIESQVIQFLF